MKQHLKINKLGFIAVTNKNVENNNKIASTLLKIIKIGVNYKET